ncbi:MAG: hypothetical protein HC763_04635 [Hydrococcus sp. CRU_1_1]|nr:hypothetical protein [Hydrococcus sp. CRU_1_1]
MRSRHFDKIKFSFSYERSPLATDRNEAYKNAQVLNSTYFIEGIKTKNRTTDRVFLR